MNARDDDRLSLMIDRIATVLCWIVLVGSITQMIWNWWGDWM